MSDEPRAELAVTALYTAQTWSWAGVASADLYVDFRTRLAFCLTNLVVGLARLFRPSAPSLRHSLAQRHQVFDALTAEAPQVLELACGLSPRGATRSADPHVRYVEVDLPVVVDHKRTRLQTTEQGRAVLGRDNHTFVAADVRTFDPADHLDLDQPLVVIAEGLLMYFDEPTRKAQWARVASWLDHPDARFVFDLTPAAEEPPPGLLGRALGWLMRRATEGHDIARDAQTRDTLRQELAAAGLEVVAIYDPTQPPDDLTLGWTGVPTWFVVWSCRRTRPVDA